MASLLSPNDVAAAQAALESVMETFYTFPIKIRRVEANKPTRWGNETKSAVEYDLPALYEQSANQTDIAQDSTLGAYEDYDGAFSLSFKVMDTAGLVANGRPAINAATDTIEYQGLLYDILGVHPLGAFVERYEYVVIIVKRSPRSL
jgi:hypothetical protein